MVGSLLGAVTGKLLVKRNARLQTYSKTDLVFEKKDIAAVGRGCCLFDV